MSLGKNEDICAALAGEPVEQAGFFIGMGYTTIQSSYRDVTVKTSYFVPLNDNLEIWDVTVTNDGTTSKSLALFSFIEFALWMPGTTRPTSSAT